MNIVRICVGAFVLVLLTLVAAPAIFSCECVAPVLKERTVSYEFERSETVIGVIVLTEPDTSLPIEQQSAKVRIEKVYKGKVNVGEILTFGHSYNKDCLWHFSKANVGMSYLFYLAKPTKGLPYKTTEEIEKSNAELKYYVSTCGRSAEIEKAVEDIAYLDEQPPEPRR